MGTRPRAFGGVAGDTVYAEDQGLDGTRGVRRGISGGTRVEVLRGQQEAHVEFQ